jgi:menaquinol-cytochrome c reductase iron-sulfur subunit
MKHLMYPAATDREIGRRAMMQRAIYMIPTLIGGVLAACFGSYVFGKQQTRGTRWADAGEISEVEDGTPHQIRFEKAIVDGWTVRAQQASAWVVIDEKRQVTAFSPACPHLGCAYGWHSDKKRFVCPCHGSSFDIHGNVITGPASRPLDRYSTKLEDNRLWLGPQKDAQGV